MDVFALQWANNPVVSPDGRRVVCERGFYDVMKDKRRSNLWLVDLADDSQRPLTTGNTNDGQAAWSPDGRRIAYVAADGDKSQIFVRWLDTGQTARVTQLTESPGNLGFSPDGRWIAFTMHVASRPEPLARMPEPPRGAEWAQPFKVIDGLIYRADGSGYVEPGYTHVFVVAAEGGAPRQLTSGDHQIQGRPVWTRDGKSLIVSTNLDADRELQPNETELYRLDVDGGGLKRLTNREGPDRSPAVSPDGKRVAYVGFDDRKLGYQNLRLSVLDLATGSTRVLTGALDRGVENPMWDGDRGIFFHFDDHGETKVGWIAANGGNAETLASDFGGTSLGRPYTGGAMHAAGGRAAYTRNDPTRPADLAVVSRGAKARRLTDLNANLLAHRELGKVEALEWKSPAHRFDVQGWLVYPPGFDASKTYPLLVEIHGGPYADYGPHFAPETQLYAAQGYIVLYPNMAGSASYGEEFANLIHLNHPGPDYTDIMAGVDAVIARGDVDADNLFVTGGSGGGLMTAWIVGHTDRFRAAVSAKPVINWYSFVLTVDAYPLFVQYWFEGPPWEQTEDYMKRSPIAYVGNVKTPNMLITGESDHRTPISESEQFYQALKLRRVETALVRVPGASHAINTRPSQMIAQVLHTIAWFEKHRATAAQ
jgi:acylaminoacyl-peptidase